MKEREKQSELKRQYKKLEGQKKDSWSMIQELNKLYKVDRILLKEAYDTYPKKQLLEKSNEYGLIEKFYRYIMDHLDDIEKKYFMTENEQTNQSTYMKNKNITSKFIRDEADHYQKIFNKHTEAVNQDEFSLAGRKICDFMKQMFATQYTEVFLDQEKYFTIDRSEEIKNVVSKYYEQMKEISKEEFSFEGVWLAEEQILDFLSFWLKQMESQQLYILYCRTQDKLKKDIASLLESRGKKENFLGGKSEQIFDKETSKKESQEVIINQKEDLSQFKSESQQNKGIRQASSSEPKNIFDKYRKKQSKQQIILEKKNRPTQKQAFEKVIPQIFLMGCKRRFINPGGRTFDEISAQMKVMNLEKFYNFCRFCEIPELLSKQLIFELFKMYAKNRLTLDALRFKNVLMRMAQMNEKVIEKFMEKIKKKKIEKGKKGFKSDYKFLLTPVNGKDVESLQQELKEKKLLKSKSKQERMQLFFEKKRHPQKFHSRFKKQKRAQISLSNLPDRTSILDLENMRDEKFDPKNWIGDQKDQILFAYESKIWKNNKEESGVLINKKYTQPPILETALSKRIEKGQRVVNKLTEKNIKLYS